MNGKPASGAIKHETETDKLLCGHIPRVGEVITLQREYVTNLGYHEMNGFVIADSEKADYECGVLDPAVRSHIAHTTVEQVYGNTFTGKRQNGVYLQAGDTLLDTTTNVIHIITQVKRGYYTVGEFGRDTAAGACPPRRRPCVYAQRPPVCDGRHTRPQIKGLALSGG